MRRGHERRQATCVSHERARRFHLPHAHLESVFGDDWFGLKAEELRPLLRHADLPHRPDAHRRGLDPGERRSAGPQFDVYPFILLNLAFSLQAAYAAPLILLAQTRQADRDKAMSIADAQHREELHQVNEERQQQMQQQSELMFDMLQQNTALTETVEKLLRQNTELTETVRTLVQRIETMTAEVHSRLARPAT